ncbi:MAG: hypothetical protein KF799_03280 [Bdellovibrionales bacterium]|nr:hypothetical protein [Bdellovibrionales bacterium]
MEITNRRSFLKFGATAAGALVVSKQALAAAAPLCALTPQQDEGPFYPGESKFTVTNDLTRVEGHLQRAAGQVIYVKGRVVDQNCRPVVDANVEIWQACATGKYNNRMDPNPAAIDPNFRFWGEAFTDANGEYMFKTIVPGSYPADSGWIRPPHIHFRVAKIGYVELITQMYFKGNKYNDSDLILQGLPADQRDSVVVDFGPSDATLEPASLTGHFDITFRSLR